LRQSGIYEIQKAGRARERANTAREKNNKIINNNKTRTKSHNTTTTTTTNTQRQQQQQLQQKIRDTSRIIATSKMLLLYCSVIIEWNSACRFSAAWCCLHHECFSFEIGHFSENQGE
jgi:hypothetical protein